MENILAFDTSQSALSVSFRYQGKVFSRHEALARAQAQNILAYIDAVLSDAGVGMSAVDLVCVGAGPGSFTGIRIAISVAQGLAFSQGILVSPISSLACMAQQCYLQTGHEKVLVAIDARMGEVYYGAYELDSSLGIMVGRDALCAPASILLPFTTSFVGVGNGFEVYQNQLEFAEMNDSFPAILPCAEYLILIAEMTKQRILPNQAQPMYIRNNVVIDSAG